MGYLMLAGICLIPILIGYVVYDHFKSISNMKKFNFDWYRRQFPEFVSNRGVKCYKCKSPKVGTERVMNRTYMRSHICRQCGTTLYYTPE